ncbi:MAG: septum formation protein Maf [Muribaculaceae bacterium]|nr:septum formation protein Maf [Muribaculaceae bacterium]
MLENLKNYKILLCSKSPRRRELLADLRIPFTVVTAGDVKENYPDTLPPIDVPQFLSEQKAEAYRGIMKDGELLITADTLVICENEILGKPHDADEAVAMLKKLSGKTHQVATGVTLTTLRKRVSFTTVTDVKFAELTDEIIRYYVDTFQPYDKAGAYGIQEWIGCVAVESIRGSFYNVMGLPVHQLYRQLSLF